MTAPEPRGSQCSRTGRALWWHGRNLSYLSMRATSRGTRISRGNRSELVGQWSRTRGKWTSRPAQSPELAVSLFQTDNFLFIGHE